MILLNRECYETNSTHCKGRAFSRVEYIVFYKYDLELAINLLYYLVIDKERRAVMTETSESNL